MVQTFQDTGDLQKIWLKANADASFDSAKRAEVYCSCVRDLLGKLVIGNAYKISATSN